MIHNTEKLREKINETLASVLPITAIVLVLCFSVAPIPNNLLAAFIIGAAMLVFGMGFFTLGADTSMMPIGESIGSHITKSRKIVLIIVVSFLIGFSITMSEPDLQVLASQVPNIDTSVLIYSVAAGVGLFLVIALMRILFSIPLNYLLIGFYAIIFGLCAFVDSDFWAVAFDAGGVTTGPMTVPFIMALGIGVSSSRSDKHASNDSFGLVALSSVGPIMAVLILGMIYPAEGTHTPVIIPDAADSRELWGLFADALPHYAKEVCISLLPIIAFFLIFHFFALKLDKKRFLKIVIGLVFTYVGLVLFLTGVNVGFMPAGNFLGQQMALLDYNWVLVPISMLIGYFIVTAEPAVHVLNNQVEEMTSGAIPSKAMNLSLSIGVAISSGLSMIRVLTGISIMWFLISGYLIAIVLTFFVPKIFTAIAFDSGGVASGPMTATFLLPLAMGACEALGKDVVSGAFGVVAMVAMTPLITIQILGLVYNIKLKRSSKEQGVLDELTPVEDELIEL